MALQIRRGLEADRSSITPIEGELLYVTDTGSVYIGDGSTAGGNLVKGDVVDDTTPQLGGDLDLNGSNIVGTGNINITGTITATGNINLGDGSEDNIFVGGQLTSGLTPDEDSAFDIGSAVLRWRNGFFNGLSVDGEINAFAVNAQLLADDSTIAYDPTNGVFEGTVFLGAFEGPLVGDVKGSVFADNSTVLVDGAAGKIRGDIESTEIILTSPKTSVNEILLEKQSDVDEEFSVFANGQIAFGRNDINGQRKTAIITAFQRTLVFFTDDTGVFDVNGGTLMALVAGDGTPEQGGKLGLGTFSPAEKLDVRGNGVFSGDVTAAAFKGSLMADDSTTIIDANNGTIVAGGFIQFGSYSDAEIALITPSNGMVYYNTTDNRFRGYQNNSWINLDDGSAA